MKHLILAAFLALSIAAPLAAAHAETEGNGPSFPGLQIPNVGVAIGPYGRQAVATEEHSSDVYNSQVAQSPFPQYGTPAQNRRTLSMIEAATPNG